MALKLNPVQRRVFGVLIEKSLTTPGSYPLTVNAVVTGCNQLTCRDPVMAISDGEVGKALHDLQLLDLVCLAPPDSHARANRFQHLAAKRFGWTPHEQAVMAELLLRGPQTVGELKGNASRMRSIPDIQGVSAVIEELSRRDPPLVRELPRQPGKSTVRFDHLLYSDNEAPPTPPAATAASAPRQEDPALSAGIAERLARLEEEVALLRRQVAALQDGAPASE